MPSTVQNEATTSDGARSHPNDAHCKLRAGGYGRALLLLCCSCADRHFSAATNNLQILAVVATHRDSKLARFTLSTRARRAARSLTAVAAVAAVAAAAAESAQWAASRRFEAMR